MTMTATVEDLQVRKAAGNIGAVISGVSVSGELSAEAVAAIRSTLLEHKVVFFRGQHHVDEAEQVAFASRLGQVTTAHPTVPGYQNNPHVLDLDSVKSGGGHANYWHTDVTFVDQPPAFSVLRSVVIPEYGGDTVWANTARAYRNLPAELRSLADALWAVHGNEFDFAAPGASETVRKAVEAYHEVFVSETFETLHPVVRVHPETEERTLLLGNFVRQFRNFGKTESAAILRLFQDRITALENTVRWHWREADVVVWDNRATQHYAVADYGDLERIVRRVTVAGEVPVAIDGTPSAWIRGDASKYYRQAA
jgi:taurine dioxygenase